MELQRIKPLFHQPRPQRSCSTEHYSSSQGGSRQCPCAAWFSKYPLSPCHREADERDLFQSFSDHNGGLP